MHRRIVAIALGTFAVCGCGSPTQTESQTSSATPPVAGSAADPDGRRRTPPAGDADAGTAPVATGFGDPLQGLTAAERASFDDGKVHFATAEELEEGLGPVLNEASCVACHAGPAVGGSNGRLETRFGRRGADGGFDPLAAEGGSLLQDHGIGAVDGFTFGPEVVPADANVVAQRRTTPLFGLGLVDATPDDTIRAIAAKQARTSPETAASTIRTPTSCSMTWEVSATASSRAPRTRSRCGRRRSGDCGSRPTCCTTAARKRRWKRSSRTTLKVAARTIASRRSMPGIGRRCSPFSILSRHRLETTEHECFTCAS